MRRKHKSEEKFKGKFLATLIFERGSSRYPLSQFEELKRKWPNDWKEKLSIIPKAGSGGKYGMSFPNDPNNYEIKICGEKRTLEFVCENEEYFNDIVSREYKLNPEFELICSGRERIR